MTLGCTLGAVPIDREHRAARQRAKKLLSACKARLAQGTASSPDHAASAERPGFEVVAPEVVPDLAQYLKRQSLTDAEVDEALKLAEWAWVELNYRPHAYQACALTT